MISRWPVAFLSCTALAVAATGASATASVDPADNAHLGPQSSVGTYLGDPSPTSIWHGCTKTATKQTQVPREDGQQPVRRGNAQTAVAFTLASTPPLLSWKAKPGWTICGVQVSATLSVPSDPANLLLAETAYPSGTAKGSSSTAAGARESVKVHISKDARMFRGKTGSIYQIYDVTVFVKRR